MNHLPRFQSRPSDGVTINSRTAHERALAVLDDPYGGKPIRVIRTATDITPSPDAIAGKIAQIRKILSDATGPLCAEEIGKMVGFRHLASLPLHRWLPIYGQSHGFHKIPTPGQRGCRWEIIK